MARRPARHRAHPDPHRPPARSTAASTAAVVAPSPSEICQAARVTRRPSSSARASSIRTAGTDTPSAPTTIRPVRATASDDVELVHHSAAAGRHRLAARGLHPSGPIRHGRRADPRAGGQPHPDLGRLGGRRAGRPPGRRRHRHGERRLHRQPTWTCTPPCWRPRPGASRRWARSRPRPTSTCPWWSRCSPADHLGHRADEPGPETHGREVVTDPLAAVARRDVLPGHRRVRHRRRPRDRDGGRGLSRAT